MAFPTVVNGQVTDAVQNGAENNNTPLTEKILQTSYAFTQTLEMENAVFQKQMNGIVQMALDVVQKIIMLRKIAEENGSAPDSTEPLKTLEELKQQLTEAGKAATAGGQASQEPGTPVTTAGKNETALEATVLQAIGESYKNAVYAQQQAYVTMQAATTLVITTILSTDNETMEAPGLDHLPG